MVNMKNNISILACLLPILLLLTSGCAKKFISLKQEPIRYQKIEIPAYSKGDYEKLLTAKNYEVRYNAICNLIQYAGDYGRLLSKKPDTDNSNKEPKDKSDIKNAQHVFNEILDQLNNPNESLKAASLVFLAEFASTYSENTELIDRVLRVKTKDVGTKYEQLHALIQMSDPTTVMDPIVLNAFLDWGSWIINSKTFVLLSKIDSENIHKRLKDEYVKSDDEFDKMLIIKAFSKSFGNEIFDLLTNELLKSRSNKIKKLCAGIIKNNRNDADVIKWLIEYHRSVDDDILKTVIKSYYDELETQKGEIFFRGLILSGQEKLVHAANQEIFFSRLYHASKNQSGSKPPSKIEAAIDDNEFLRSSWLNYRTKFEKEEFAEKEKEELFEKKILPKYNKMLESFLKESEKLFTDEGLSKKEVEEATAGIRQLLQYFEENQ